MATSKRNKSGYRGVSWHKVREKWLSKITVNGETIIIGFYDNVEDAAKAYEEAAIQYGRKENLRPNMSYNEYQRYYYDINKEKIREEKKEYRKKNSDKLKVWHKNNYQKRRVEHLKQQKEYNDSVKKAVFDHYGNKCVCCGETEPKFLTMDHINNDGYKHRKKTGCTASTNMYKLIKRENFPTSYQILCWNCNCGRARTPTKECPHKLNKQQDNIINHLCAY